MAGGILTPPVSRIEELFDFLETWHDVPATVGPVDAPPELPAPLAAMHARFGQLASKECALDRGSETDFWAEGIFCAQDLLVPLTRFHNDVFTASEGPFAGQRMFSFIHENQRCWLLHVPLGLGSDPPVLCSDPRDDGISSAQRQSGMSLVEVVELLDRLPKKRIFDVNTRIVAPTLSAFLAVFALRNAAFGAQHSGFHWSPHSPSLYRIPLIPIMLDTQYVDEPYDFYADASSRVLVMHHTGCDMTFVSSLDDNIADQMTDPSILEKL